MKKLVLFTTGLVLTALAGVNAQNLQPMKAKKTTDGAKYWSLGPIGGFGHSWVSKMDNRNFMPSGELGLGVIYSRNEHWGFGGDLTGSTEGYSTNYMMNNVEYNTDVVPIYLRLTPKVYYFFGDYGDMVRPKVYAGPSVAYKMTEQSSVTASGVPSGDQSTTVLANGDMFNDVDFGVKVGAGANIQVAKSTWFNVDAGYYQGLVDATDNMETNLNSNLRLNLGLMFGL